MQLKKDVKAKLSPELCIITLIVTILLGGTQPSGFVNRSCAWICGRPRQKSDGRLALEAQWSMEQAVLVTQRGHTHSELTRVRLWELELLMTHSGSMGRQSPPVRVF